MKIFFTSDTHFGHKHIIDFSFRPFVSLEEHDRKLIENWNEVVSPEDTVYHLGDFAMGQASKHSDYVSQLNGYKILIRGNHDPTITKNLSNGWNEVHNNKLLEMDGFRLYLRHIPPSHESDKYKPFLQQPPVIVPDFWLCGHVHARWASDQNVINVGVDVRNYRPQDLHSLLTSVKR